MPLGGTKRPNVTTLESWASLAEFVEGSAVSFGWAAGAAVSFEDRGDKFFSWAGRAVIDVAVHRNRRTDSLVDHLDHF